jgi:WD40 repeat protein
MKTGKELAPLPWDKYDISSLAYSGDGHYLAAVGTTNDSAIHLWDLRAETDSILFHPPRRMTFSLRFSPNSQLLAAVESDLGPRTPGQAHIWDLTGGPQKSTLENCGRVLAFVSNDRLLVEKYERRPPNRAILLNGEPVSQADRLGLAIIDLASRKTIFMLPGQTEHCWDVTVTPRGDRVAAADVNRMVSVWSLTDNQPVLRLTLLQAGTRVAFSPDGKTLAVENEETHSLSLWSLDGLHGPQKTSVVTLLSTTAWRSFARWPNTGIGLLRPATALRPES